MNVFFFFLTNIHYFRSLAALCCTCLIYQPIRLLIYYLTAGGGGGDCEVHFARASFIKLAARFMKMMSCSVSTYLCACPSAWSKSLYMLPSLQILVYIQGYESSCFQQPFLPGMLLNSKMTKTRHTLFFSTFYCWHCFMHQCRRNVTSHLYTIQVVLAVFIHFQRTVSDLPVLMID